MIKRKRKAFTIVELVIVIAVIAVLAAVLIPTFSSIIQKANESADIQAVRQMNMALMAESAVETPTEIKEVIRILKNAGYNATDKLVPVSAGHGFYWCKAANMITLIRDEGDNAPEIIFPLDNETLTTAFNDSKAGGLTADEGFYDLEAGATTYLPQIEAEEENTGGGEEITTATDLKAALEAGGTVQLGGDVTIETADQAITIPSGTTTTLDLNGHTLTLADESVEGFDVITVLPDASLTITDSGNGKGIVIEAPTNSDAMSFYGGIFVDDGTLMLNNVNVEGYRQWNIYDSGSPGYYNFTDVMYTVYGGYGFRNKGDGSAVIDNCTFICNGNATSAIYCLGGTVDVYDSEFVEGTDFVEYYYNSPIEAHSNGVVTLEDSTVTTSGAYSVFAGTNGIVVINSGSFNTKILCVGDNTSATIYGGTVNGVAFENITADSAIFDGADFELSYDDVKKCWIIS